MSRPGRYVGPLRLRLCVLATAIVHTAMTAMLFVWAWQYRSPTLIVFGLILAPMAWVWWYGVALAFERSVAPLAAWLIEQGFVGRAAQSGWASHTPQAMHRYRAAQQGRTSTSPNTPTAKASGWKH